MASFIKLKVRTSFIEFLKMTEQLAPALPADIPPHPPSAPPLKHRKPSPVALAGMGDESAPLHSLPGARSQLPILQELIKSLPGNS